MRQTLLVLAALVLFAGPVSGQQVSVLDPTGKWVTDAGDFLAPNEERFLSRMLSDYADSTSTQIVIVTVKDLGGASAFDYAVTLGRKWKVGQEGKNNGIVLLLSRAEHEIFISTGYGMEGAITDALSGKIIRSLMLPQFRNGRFFDGLRDGVGAIMLAASGEFQADDIPDDQSDGRGVPLSALIFIGFIVYSIVSSLGRRHGGGKGGHYRRNSSLLPIILWSALGGGGRGGFGGGGFGGGGFGGGGFGGGGGSFGGGGAGGSW
jgi:uncharacterized protein